MLGATSYSDDVGSAIDQKRHMISFGVNKRGLQNTVNPFKRSGGYFTPSSHSVYSQYHSLPNLCTFDTTCCNQPDRISVTGRLKECKDLDLYEKSVRWTGVVPPHVKRYTTAKIGLDRTEN